MAENQDFFTEEAKMARSALRNLVKDTGKKLQKDGDVRPLIQQRPWISMLAAAAGGMVTGYLVTPPRLEPEEKRRLRAIRKHRKHGHPHRFQKKLTDAVTPALRTFAATAAGALFQNFNHGGEEHEHHPGGATGTAAGDEYAHIPHQRIQI